MNKYKYTDGDGEHLHQILKEDEYKPLTGTSSVLSVLSKPLHWWAVGVALELFGFKKAKDSDGNWLKKEIRLESAKAGLEKVKALEPDGFLKLLDEAYYAHNKKKDSAAQGGKDIHALAETWIKGQMNGSNTEPDPSIMPLVNWAKANVDKWLWSEMNCYSETHWLGGISDAGFLDKEGKVGILDLKSSKEAYLSQFIQCAGYDIQITENGGYNAEGDKVFDLDGKQISYYAIFPFGMKEPTAVLKGNVEDLKQGFLSALNLYRLTNN